MHTTKRPDACHERNNEDRNNEDFERNDEGFSFAQVIVTMVIVGILGSAIGFTAFQFIGESRNTVLASNTRVAAEAVQNILALKPDLMPSAVDPNGGVGTDLLTELANTAGFVWLDGTAGAPGSAGGAGWQFHAQDTLGTVRVQAILDGTAAAATDVLAPVVSWLVGSGDAVRVHIRNDDGAWACALIVMRPNWDAGSDTQDAQADAALRGIWYDSGVSIVEDPAANADVQKETGGKHHCSPARVDPAADGRFGRTSGTFNDPSPDDATAWNIPADDDGDADGSADIAARDMRRTVPAIGG